MRNMFLLVVRAVGSLVQRSVPNCRGGCLNGVGECSLEWRMKLASMTKGSGVAQRRDHIKW